ncbi:titin homolog [Varroa destructor]|uniref:Uncharacterized protein n=1 Tax=Varroa destructor TaxID=109461 RepID=A0A7M7J3N8_VARDE|nr:titin homolog [Varroa destructor]XP_022646439.1 titin homolog [Varroa destructor]
MASQGAPAPGDLELQNGNSPADNSPDSLQPASNLAQVFPAAGTLDNQPPSAAPADQRQLLEGGLGLSFAEELRQVEESAESNIGHPELRHFEDPTANLPPRGSVTDDNRNVQEEPDVNKNVSPVETCPTQLHEAPLAEPDLTSLDSQNALKTNANKQAKQDANADFIPKQETAQQIVEATTERKHTRALSMSAAELEKIEQEERKSGSMSEKSESLEVQPSSSRAASLDADIANSVSADIDASGIPETESLNEKKFKTTMVAANSGGNDWGPAERRKSAFSLSDLPLPDFNSGEQSTMPDSRTRTGVPASTVSAKQNESNEKCNPNRNPDIATSAGGPSDPRQADAPSEEGGDGRAVTTLLSSSAAIVESVALDDVVPLQQGDIDPDSSSKPSAFAHLLSSTARIAESVALPEPVAEAVVETKSLPAEEEEISNEQSAISALLSTTALLAESVVVPEVVEAIESRSDDNEVAEIAHQIVESACDAAVDQTASILGGSQPESKNQREPRYDFEEALDNLRDVSPPQTAQQVHELPANGSNPANPENKAPNICDEMDEKSCDNAEKQMGVSTNEQKEQGADGSPSTAVKRDAEPDTDSGTEQTASQEADGRPLQSEPAVCVVPQIGSHESVLDGSSVAASDMFSSLGSSLSSAGQALSAKIEKAGENIQKKATEVGNKIEKTTSEANQKLQETAAQVAQSTSDAKDVSSKKIEEVRDMAKEVKDSAVESLKDVKGSVEDQATELAGKAKDAIQVSKEAAVQKATDLKDSAEKTVQEVKDAAKETADNLQKVATDVKDNTIESLQETQKAVDDKVGHIRDTVAEKISDVDTAVKENVEKFEQVAADVQDSIIESAQTAKADAEERVKDAKKIIEETAEDTKNIVKDTVDEAKQIAIELKESAVESSQKVKETAKDLIQTVKAETADTVGAVTAEIAGAVDAGKQTIIESAKKAKEVTEEIKDSAAASVKDASREVEDKVDNEAETSDRKPSAPITEIAQAIKKGAESTKEIGKDVVDPSIQSIKGAKETSDAIVADLKETVTEKVFSTSATAKELLEAGESIVKDTVSDTKEKAKESKQQADSDFSNPSEVVKEVKDSALQLSKDTLAQAAKVGEALKDSALEIGSTVLSVSGKKSPQEAKDESKVGADNMEKPASAEIKKTDEHKEGDEVAAEDNAEIAQGKMEKVCDEANDSFDKAKQALDEMSGSVKAVAKDVRESLDDITTSAAAAAAGKPCAAQEEAVKKANAGKDKTADIKDVVAEKIEDIWEGAAEKADVAQESVQEAAQKVADKEGDVNSIASEQAAEVAYSAAAQTGESSSNKGVVQKPDIKQADTVDAAADKPEASKDVTSKGVVEAEEEIAQRSAESLQKINEEVANKDETACAADIRENLTDVDHSVNASSSATNDKPSDKQALEGVSARLETVVQKDHDPNSEMIVTEKWESNVISLAKHQLDADQDELSQDEDAASVINEEKDDHGFDPLSSKFVEEPALVPFTVPRVPKERDVETLLKQSDNVLSHTELSTNSSGTGAAEEGTLPKRSTEFSSLTRPLQTSPSQSMTTSIYQPSYLPADQRTDAIADKEEESQTESTAPEPEAELESGCREPVVQETHHDKKKQEENNDEKKTTESKLSEGGQKSTQKGETEKTDEAQLQQAHTQEIAAAEATADGEKFSVDEESKTGAKLEEHHAVESQSSTAKDQKPVISDGSPLYAKGETTDNADDVDRLRLNAPEETRGLPDDKAVEDSKGSATSETSAVDTNEKLSVEETTAAMPAEDDITVKQGREQAHTSEEQPNKSSIVESSQTPETDDADSKEAATSHLAEKSPAEETTQENKITDSSETACQDVQSIGTAEAVDSGTHEAMKVSVDENLPEKDEKITTGDKAAAIQQIATEEAETEETLAEKSVAAAEVEKATKETSKDDATAEEAYQNVMAGDQVQEATTNEAHGKAPLEKAGEDAQTNESPDVKDETAGSAAGEGEKEELVEKTVRANDAVEVAEVAARKAASEEASEEIINGAKVDKEEIEEESTIEKADREAAEETLKDDTAAKETSKNVTPEHHVEESTTDKVYKKASLKKEAEDEQIQKPSDASIVEDEKEELTKNLSGEDKAGKIEEVAAAGKSASEETATEEKAAKEEIEVEQKLVVDKTDREAGEGILKDDTTAEKTPKRITTEDHVEDATVDEVCEDVALEKTAEDEPIEEFVDAAKGAAFQAPAVEDEKEQSIEELVSANDAVKVTEEASEKTAGKEISEEIAIEEIKLKEEIEADENPTIEKADREAAEEISKNDAVAEQVYENVTAEDQIEGATTDETCENAPLEKTTEDEEIEEPVDASKDEIAQAAVEEDRKEELIEELISADNTMEVAAEREDESEKKDAEHDKSEEKSDKKDDAVIKTMAKSPKPKRRPRSPEKKVKKVAKTEDTKVVSTVAAKKSVDNKRPASPKKSPVKKPIDDTRIIKTSTKPTSPKKTIKKRAASASTEKKDSEVEKATKDMSTSEKSATVKKSASPFSSVKPRVDTHLKETKTTSIRRELVLKLDSSRTTGESKSELNTPTNRPQSPTKKKRSKEAPEIGASKKKAIPSKRAKSAAPSAYRRFMQQTTSEVVSSVPTKTKMKKSPSADLDAVKKSKVTKSNKAAANKENPDVNGGSIPKSTSCNSDLAGKGVVTATTTTSSTTTTAVKRTKSPCKQVVRPPWTNYFS